MPEVRKNEYVVVQTTKESGGLNRPQLLKVVALSSTSDEFSGRLEKDPHLHEVHITAKSSDVLVNLGKRPKPGKVYGYDLARLYLQTTDDVHFFASPDEKNLAAFNKGVERGQILLKKKFSRLVDACSYITEVVPKHGKYAGMYLHSGNAEKSPHRVRFSVGDDTLATASVGSYTYVFLHEHCHAIHFQLLSEHPKLNSQWLKLFVESIGSRSIKAERCASLLQELLASEGGVKGFLGEASDESKADLKLVLKWLREFRNLSAREVDLMIQEKGTASKATLEEVWPRVSVRSKKLKPMITEYACKSWRELFAESCTLYLMNKELPARVVDLVEKSLSLANQLAASK